MKSRAPLCFGLALYAVLLLVTLIYRPGLNGPWLLDDLGNLGVLRFLENPDVPVRDVLTTNQAGLLGRALSMMSFAADFAAAGLDAHQFKHTNLLIHLLCTCLVFWLTLELGRTLCPERPAHAAALAACALWAVAPLLVSTVLYAVQRMSQLACLFSLAGCLSYCAGRRIAQERRWSGRALQLASVILWLPLAVFSKENGVLLPLLMLCAETFIYRFQGERPARRWAIGLFVAIVGIPAMLALGWLLTHPGMYLAGYEDRSFTFAERLLTQPRVLLDYLRQLFLPSGGQLGLYHDDFPLSSGWLSPPATLAALIALAGAGILLVRARRPATRALAFGLAFFLAGHVLESSIFSLEIYFEHRNYLPAAGLLIGLVLAVDVLSANAPWRRSLALAVELLFAINVVATAQRAATWSDYGLILRTAVQFHPDSARLSADISIYDAQHGDIASALTALAHATALTPTLKPVEAIGRIGLHCLAGTAPDTVDYALPPPPAGWRPRGAPVIFAGAALGHLNDQLTAGACPLIDRRRLSAGLQAFLATLPVADLQGSANSWMLYFEGARTAQLADDPAVMVALLDTAMTIDPGRAEAGMMLALHHLQRGRRNQAIAVYERMKAENPRPAHYFDSELARLGNLLDATAR